MDAKISITVGVTYCFSKKKNGGLRLCCDFRLLIKKTVKDCHPIPRIAESLDMLLGSEIFSVCDLSRAYHQGFMATESRAKTSFTTPWGLYQWVRIPFGLSTAVPTFQRYMEKIVEDFRGDFAMAYLDDTIIYSKSIKEHIEQIRKVLKKFQECGFKFNVTKCELFRREVCYLGRIVSKFGYRMDPRSVQAVKDLANRKFETVGQVRELMGLLNYHRRHIQGFSELARPINDLLKDDRPPADADDKSASKQKGLPSKQKVKWGQEQQIALEQLIYFITNPPILAYANFETEFWVHCDASHKGFGAILYQEQDGVIRVIAYASRSLKLAEQHYHSSKLEFIAMKWSLCEAFRDYLSYADHFRVYTDNNPLLFILSVKQPNNTIQRWISEIAEFNFTIYYRPGEVNRDADALSRLPLDINAYKDLCKAKTSLNAFQSMVGSIEATEFHPKTTESSDQGIDCKRKISRRRACKSGVSKITKLETIREEAEPIIEEIIEQYGMTEVGQQHKKQSMETSILEHKDMQDQNVMVDLPQNAMSPPKFVQSSDTKEEPTEVIDEVEATKAISADNYLDTVAPPVENLETIQDLAKEQAQDEYIGPVLQWLELDTTEIPKEFNRMSKLLVKERKKLFFDDRQVLYRKGSRGDEQVVLPLKYREMIYRVLHTEMGHLGSERVLQLAQQRVYWPLMSSDIEQFTRERCRCIVQRRQQQLAVAPLVSIQTSTPMELVSIDFLALEESTTGCKYILLLVDHFTKYAQAYPTKNKSALTAAKCIWNDFLLRFGLVDRILHDQGKEFDNALFKELERFCGMIRSRTTSYHAQCNGQVERMNATLLGMLRTLVETDKPNWHRHLNKLLAAYNSTIHSTTGYSPFFLLYGRTPALPLDVILGKRRTTGDVPKSYNVFVNEWEGRMSEAYSIAHSRSLKAKEYDREHWRNNQLLASNLQVGDRVLVVNKKETGGPQKLRSYYEQEIYTVLEAKDDGVVYVVQGLKGKKRTLHRNMLRPCNLLESAAEITEVPTKPSKATVTLSQTQEDVVRDEIISSDSSESSDADDEPETKQADDNKLVIRSRASSRRTRGRVPDRLGIEMRGDVKVASNAVSVEEEMVDADTVAEPEEQKQEGGWWQWIQGTMDELGARLR